MKKRFDRQEAKNEVAGLELFAKTPWQVWLLPIVAVFILVGSFILVLVPQVTGWFETREEIAIAKNTLEKLESKRRALENLSEIELDRQFEIVDSALPGRTPMMEAIRSFVFLANETEVELSDYSLKPGSLATESAELAEASQSGLSSLDLELRVRGVYENVMLFVERLENLAPLVHVKESTYIVINTDEEGRELSADDARDVSVSLDISLFFSRPVSFRGSASAPLPDLSAKQREVIDRSSRLERVDIADLLDTELPPRAQDREDVFRF